MLSVAKRQSFAISCKLWGKHSLFCPFAIRFKTQELLFAGPLWSTAYQLVSHMFDRPAPFLVIFTPKKSLQCWLCARDIIGSLPLGQCSHCFSGTWTSLDFWKDPNIGEPSFKEKLQKHTYRPQKPQESDQFCFQCTTYKKSGVHRKENWCVQVFLVAALWFDPHWRWLKVEATWGPPASNVKRTWAQMGDGQYIKAHYHHHHNHHHHFHQHHNHHHHHHHEHHHHHHHHHHFIIIVIVGIIIIIIITIIIITIIIIIILILIIINIIIIIIFISIILSSSSSSSSSSLASSSSSSPASSSSSSSSSSSPSSSSLPSSSSYSYSSSSSLSSSSSTSSSSASSSSSFSSASYYHHRHRRHHHH